SRDSHLHLTRSCVMFNRFTRTSSRLSNALIPTSQSRHWSRRGRRLRPAIEELEDRVVLSPVLYAHDRNGKLFDVDVPTGQVNVIGTMSAVMFDIAFDSSGDLYGVDQGSSLYRIDPRTAATTAIGPVGGFVNGLVFAPDGTLYGAGSEL